MIKRNTFVSIYIIVPETTLASEAHLAGQIVLEKETLNIEKLRNQQNRQRFQRSITDARAGYVGRSQKHLKDQNKQHQLDADRDNGSRKVKKGYQISNCRFRFDEAMLIGINFKVTQNMFVNYECDTRRILPHPALRASGS
jgi:hypothetical protein